MLGEVENGTVTPIGATTEYHSLEVITTLLSSCQVYVLKPNDYKDLMDLSHDDIATNIEMNNRSFVFDETDA